MPLYPPIEPFDSGMLKVSNLHQIYYEQSGNPQGIPIVFLHGGPGGGFAPTHRQYFDPKKWRVVLFDQRGCGKSLPHSELRENTTWDLVADIEKIRVHLGIEKWAVFGGSWGSTLALAYGQTHPEACLAFFLRGIFMLRQKELLWFYQEGASRIFPDLWEKYYEWVPKEQRYDLMEFYYRALQSSDLDLRRKAAYAWSTWEGATSKLILDPTMVSQYGGDAFADAFARIESHYFIHKGFFTKETQLLDDVEKIKHLPGYIVHGRYDMVCPVESAWELHKRWPGSKLEIIANAGHALAEEGTTETLLKWLAAY